MTLPPDRSSQFRHGAWPGHSYPSDILDSSWKAFLGWLSLSFSVRTAPRVDILCVPFRWQIIYPWKHFISDLLSHSTRYRNPNPCLTWMESSVPINELCLKPQWAEVKPGSLGLDLPHNRMKLKRQQNGMRNKD